MAYKKKHEICTARHPERDVQCWDLIPGHEWHWAYVPAAHSSVVKVTWK